MSASHLLSSRSRTGCSSVSTVCCSALLSPRLSTRRLTRRLSINLRYVIHNAGVSQFKPQSFSRLHTYSLDNTMVGLRPRKGQVQLRLRSFQSGQTPRYPLFQRLPHPLEHRWFAHCTICARQPLGRNSTVASLHLPDDLGGDHHRSAILILPPLRPRGEVRFQQDDNEHLGYGHDQGSGSRTCFRYPHR